jgi:hypothetical protein
MQQRTQVKNSWLESVWNGPRPHLQHSHQSAIYNHCELSMLPVKHVGQYTHKTHISPHSIRILHPALDATNSIDNAKCCCPVAQRSLPLLHYTQEMEEKCRRNPPCISVIHFDHSSIVHHIRIILLYPHFCLPLSYMHRCVWLIMLYLHTAPAKFTVVSVPPKTNSFILSHVPHSTVCHMLSCSNYTSQFESVPLIHCGLRSPQHWLCLCARMLHLPVDQSLLRLLDI